MTTDLTHWQQFSDNEDFYPYGRDERVDSKLRALYVGQGADQVHSHNDLYYTKVLMDARYSSISHSHTIVTHNHDSRYTAINHVHDTRYSPINHTHTIPTVQGAQGPRGPRGFTGPRGPKGDKGDRGFRGFPGSDGDDGDDGDDGRYVSSITGSQSGTRVTLTFHLSDRTSQKAGFNVPESSGGGGGDHPDSDHYDAFYRKVEVDARFYTRTYINNNFALKNHTHSGGGNTGGGGDHPDSDHYDAFYTKTYIEANFAAKSHGVHGGGGSSGSSGFWVTKNPGYTRTDFDTIYSTEPFAGVPGFFTQHLLAWADARSSDWPSIGTSNSATKFDAYLRRIQAEFLIATGSLQGSSLSVNSIRKRDLTTSNRNDILVQHSLVPRQGGAEFPVTLGSYSKEWQQGHFDRIWLGGRELFHGGGSGDTLSRTTLYDYMKDMLVAKNYVYIREDDDNRELHIGTTDIPQRNNPGGGTTTTNTNHRHDDLYALKAHNHDDRYPGNGHKHTQYALDGHIHKAGTGGVKAHNHDDRYALSEHKHNYALPDHRHDNLYAPLSHGVHGGGDGDGEGGGETYTPEFDTPKDVSSRNQPGFSDKLVRADHRHKHTGIPHIKDGSMEIDGDRLGISYVPTNYSRSTNTVHASDSGHLAAHLKGIDDALIVSQVTNPTIPWTAVPSSIIPSVTNNRQLGQANKRWEAVYTEQVDTDNVFADDVYADNLHGSNSGGDIQAQDPINLNSHILKGLPILDTGDPLPPELRAATTQSELNAAVPDGSVWFGVGADSLLTTLINAIVSEYLGDFTIGDTNGKLYMRHGNNIYVFKSDGKIPI